ncbi:serine acetyltransferase [bacterium]|nr:serine acetyltransferase [bacterium]
MAKAENTNKRNSMVGVINKKGYLSFLKKVLDHFIMNIENIEVIKNDFLLYIDNDLEKFSEFKEKLPIIKDSLSKDLDFFMLSDPAIDNRDEVIFCYPGFKAIAYYRIAHELRNLGFLLVSRMITEEAHSLTGIDIHPGAKIEVPLFIDHGTGTVIGETAEIGSHVKLYQGVTLGAISLSNCSSVKGVKRHPTIGNYVTIYSCASILGNVKIGDNTTIGANVFLTEDVPSGVKVTIGKPELIIKEK